ncbi:MAG: isopenicillin N synthase family dioxygenase [Rhodospirillaceae bacterium]
MSPKPQTAFDVLSVDGTAPDAPALLTKSLRETGFAVLKNHSVPAERIKAMYQSWQAFFASEGKFDYQFEEASQTGFFPFRTENAKGVAQKDLKEFFHVYPHAKLPSDLEEITRTVYADLVSLGDTVLGWIEAHLPEEIKGALTEPLPAMVRGSDMNLLRVLHYPPLAEEGIEPGAVRAAAHEDINLITLLVSASAPGLEARSADGQWHKVPCDDGAITINVGDMLQMATGGYLPSTTHRVVNPEQSANESRYSMPMFIHPRPEARLDASTTAHIYLEERLREIGLKPAE